MKKKEVIRLLEMGAHPFWGAVDERLVAEAARAFMVWKDSDAYDPREGEGIARQMILFFNLRIKEILLSIEQLHRNHGQVNRSISRAPAEERELLILNYARDLGATRRQLRGDRRAFSRWFGADAVTDRYVRRVAELERETSFSLKRLGSLCAKVLDEEGEREGYPEVWKQLQTEETLRNLLAHKGDVRIRIEAFRALSEALRTVPQDLQQRLVDERTLRFIFRSAQDADQQVWIQCEAIRLLGRISLDALETTLEMRLLHPSSKDDLFVRHRAVRVLGEYLPRRPGLARLFDRIRQDESPYVRQALPRALGAAGEDAVIANLSHLVYNDPSPEVRAAALLEIPGFLERVDLRERVREILLHSLETERDPFVLRTALRISGGTMAEAIEKEGAGGAGNWYVKLTEVVESLHCNAENLSVRRWAAQARERIWSRHDPEARRLRPGLERRMAGISPGKRGRLPGTLAGRSDPVTLGRVCAAITQQDFGCEIGPRFRGKTLVRGHVFHFRTWRFVYEFFHPATDKRQAFSHVTGRHFTQPDHAPSAILAELSQTKVPGEPLFLESESGWRPYLPLVDQLISSLDRGIFTSPIRIFTSEGITEIRPPRLFWRRWKARTALTLRFPHYARLRNWREESRDPPDSYLQAIRRLGFSIRLRPYKGPNGDSRIDPQAARFFPALLPWGASDLWLRIKAYFFSIHENSLTDLVVYSGLIFMIFFGRILLLSRKIRLARRRIPLVIGGWGTRGKSSVERLKAALINALGYGVLSKTTGCEAMFLHAPPYGKLREMYLFRPYDKATIWEQHHLTRLADRMNADVFLWECMGLTPAYVRILQKKWMRDDLSTLTNTYPDHEDLQGPAGHNIPEVMNQFIPKKSILVTTEEQMLPILGTEAKRLGTRVREAGWLEAGLVTPDILDRFSYEEHPYNIALLLGVARELGIEADFALKEMADHVVPDIGMLKAYPISPIRSRRLEFASGMSANERFGCLSNWRRMGFDRSDPKRDPGVWITTVVNNRADRVPRSKVFAGILAEDISADRHFLIGSNLSGLTGFIHDSWESHIRGISLFSEDMEHGQDGPFHRLERMARRLRIPMDRSAVAGRLRIMLEAAGVSEPESLIETAEKPDELRRHLEERKCSHVESLIDHLREDLAALDGYEGLRARLGPSEKGDREGIDREFRKFCTLVFNRKIVVIWNFHATGDQIIDRICRETPPGFHNRIMGLQNIKGTGLDFVYRWQAWERCHDAGERMKSDDPAIMEEGVRDLAGFSEYGPLCEEYVETTVAQVKQKPQAQREQIQAELSMILSNMKNGMSAVTEDEGTADEGGRSGLGVKLLEWVEAFLDAGDAIRRRKTADRIYADMVDGRIGFDRAGQELHKLYKRQKGGWLFESFKELSRRIRKPTPPAEPARDDTV